MSTLAVLALLVGTACTQSESPQAPEGTDERSTPATSSTSPSASSRPEPTLSAVSPGKRLDLDRVSRGEPPKVAYLDHKVMILPDGNRVALRNQRVPPDFAHEAPGRFYIGFAQAGRSWLTSTDSMGVILQLHRADGSLANSWLGSGYTVASSADGRRALGTTFVIEHDGTIRRFRGIGIGFVGREVVITRRNRVYLGYPGRGFAIVPGLRAAAATASTPGLVIAESMIVPPPAFKTEARTIPGVFKLPAGKPVLLAPDPTPHFQGSDTLTLHGLSPNGEHIVATQHEPKPQALVVGKVKTGDVVAAAPGVVTEERPYWEDNRHVLVVARRVDKRSVTSYILRIGVDGTIERAAGPATAWFVLPAPRG